MSGRGRCGGSFAMPTSSHPGPAARTRPVPGDREPARGGPSNDARTRRRRLCEEPQTRLVRRYGSDYDTRSKDLRETRQPGRLGTVRRERRRHTPNRVGAVAFCAPPADSGLHLGAALCDDLASGSRSGRHRTSRAAVAGPRGPDQPGTASPPRAAAPSADGASGRHRRPHSSTSHPVPPPRRPRWRDGSASALL